MNPDLRKWLVFLGCGIGVTIIGIDYTIVFMALSTLQDFFSVGIAELQWFVLGFGIPITALMTIMGKIADKYGRRKLLYTGMFGFVATSVGAGLSPTAWVLILFRILQGTFAAMIPPASTALVARTFPQDQREKIMGIFGGFWGMGMAIGPIIGGLLLAVVSWRWIFFINVPIVIIGFALCLPSVKESKAEKAIHIDWKGMSFLFFFLLTLVFSITQGPVLGWDNWLVIAGFIISVVSLALFVIGEKRSGTPALPLNLFTHPRFVIGSLTFSVSAGAAWVVAFFCPLYLEQILGYTTLPASFLYLCLTGVVVFAAPLSGIFLHKKGAGSIEVLLFVSLLVAYALLLFFTPTSPLALVIPTFLIYGLAWGIGNGVSIPIALGQSDAEDDVALISGGVLTILNMVGIVLLALAGILFHYVQKGHLYALLGANGIALTQKEDQALQAVITAPDKANKLLMIFGSKSAQMMGFFKEAFTFGFRAVNISLIALTLLMFLGILLQFRRLRRH